MSEVDENTGVHADAMAMYSRFLLLGLGGRPGDRDDAIDWNRRARRHGSVIASCRYSLILEQEARRLYRSRLAEQSSHLGDDLDIDGANGNVDDGEPHMYYLRPSDARIVHGLGRQKQRSDSPMTAQLQRAKGRGGKRILTMINSFFHMSGHNQSPHPERADSDNQSDGAPSFASRSGSRQGSFQSTGSRGRDIVVGYELRNKLGVDALYKKARRVLMENLGGAPEKSANPLVYLLLGRLITKNLYWWTICAEEVNREKVTARLYEQKHLAEAKNYFARAANMFNQSRWRKHRVNFVEIDEQWMCDARERLDALNRNERSGPTR